MGVFVYVGTVQPQEAMAWLMTNGWSPAFVNVKVVF